MISIVTHAGAGSTRELDDLARQAAEAGMAVLQGGGEALDAAVAAAAVLEDDPRTNAGTGSILRLDGETIEMDASVADSTGRMGAVAAIRAVKNPAQVAREVSKTPHVLLAGEGATAFARQRGFPPYLNVTQRAKDRHADLVRKLRAVGRDGLRDIWKHADLEAIWNLAKSWPEVSSACDTIGAAAVDARGVSAIATSTGGASPMLLGRVGDSPLPGCGFYAGPAGAVGATGIGEEIIRKTLAKTVYDWIQAGLAPQTACEKGVALYPADVIIGLIAAAPAGLGAASNTGMAVCPLTRP